MASGSKTPQGAINEFWSKFSAKKPSKVTSIFPRLLYASLLPQHPDPRGMASTRNAAESYEAAAKECRGKVERIVRECHRTNEKFTDSDFDIECDGLQNCLNGLEYVEDEARDNTNGALERSRCPDIEQQRCLGSPGNDGVESGEYYSPGSVHRLDWIFRDNPQFTIDGFSSSDIQQGGNGDCWWLAAVATIAHRKDLMERVCVVRDEECGVYGFVFYRDGEWISAVVDDNLYLKSADFRDECVDIYDPTGEKARKHRLQNQSGSEALYFGHCSDPNETWLPLMEKAYAKAHGDYNAIAGGWSGEAVEDMTGGVTTTVATKRVLRKERLWKELAYTDGDFVFSLSALGLPISSSGVVLGHAYSILRATEEVDEDGSRVRLVQVRNPWGHRSEYDGLGEWNGKWSDGSKEWTPYWMKKLDHKFGDDGVFWMTYEDMLETFKFVHRTRLFDDKWTVIQQWTSCDVSWFTGFLRNKFLLTVEKPGTVIIVLAQLDERYFRGLAGQYKFDLHFLLKKENSSPDDYICRVRPVHEWENRSISCEVDLEPGKYEVLPKITATRDKTEPTLDKLVKQFAERNPQKLRQVGMQYDLAHAKGGIADEDLKIETQRVNERQKALDRKKRGRGGKMRVKVEIDLEDSSGPHASSKVDGGAVTQEGEGEEFEDAAESLENVDSQKTKGRINRGRKANLGLRPRTQPTLPSTGDDGDAFNKDVGEVIVIDEQDKGHRIEDEKMDNGKNEDGKGEGEQAGDEDKEASSSDEVTDSENEEDDDTRWNAVCVTCLRVYSQDPNLVISLLKPEDAEEASSLVQGQDPAGATM